MIPYLDILSAIVRCLFTRWNYDTLAIAGLCGQDEPIICRALHRAREQERMGRAG